jgi:hypothetical protein
MRSGMAQQSVRITFADRTDYSVGASLMAAAVKRSVAAAVKRSVAAAVKRCVPSAVRPAVATHMSMSSAAKVPPSGVS